MFGWLWGRRPRSARLLSLQLTVVTPYRWPQESPLLSTWPEVEANLLKERSVVFISVEWSGQERKSRATFAEFVSRIAREQSELGVWFAVLNEESEDIDYWFETLALPGSAATGYGSVVWLRAGKVVDMVPYAAEAGVEQLVGRTLRLWGETCRSTVAGNTQ